MRMLEHHIQSISFQKYNIKDCNIKFNGKIFFVQPINSDFKTYENIKKIATGQGDD